MMKASKSSMTMLSTSKIVLDMESGFHAFHRQFSCREMDSSLCTECLLLHLVMEELARLSVIRPEDLLEGGLSNPGRISSDRLSPRLAPDAIDARLGDRPPPGEGGSSLRHSGTDDWATTLRAVEVVEACWQSMCWQSAGAEPLRGSDSFRSTSGVSESTRLNWSDGRHKPSLEVSASQWHLDRTGDCELQMAS
mmetsp:Transcript_20797/g.58578  ORF Transcript_20797/g.58578 Transcript_20797/m.58578 type:complete len:194 (+) Transcript_20797:2359-2940(+)